MRRSTILNLSLKNSMAAFLRRSPGLLVRRLRFTSSSSGTPAPGSTFFSFSSRDAGDAAAAPHAPRSHLVPSGYLDGLGVQSTSSSSASPLSLAHLHWLHQKDTLGQDALLVGPTSSSPLRRRLALAYGELLQRPVQVVTITSDLTESDLKQRRELRRVVSSSSSSDGDGNDATAASPPPPPPLELRYTNASPVDAAVHGDLLILDGMERASRNVLPTLNNLLEHRSMNLEDGRLLVPQHTYDLALQQQEQQQSATGRKGGGTLSNDVASLLVPVHPDFRVIATAVPGSVPGGKPLDPPLRSRFQIRRVDNDNDDVENFLLHALHSDEASSDSKNDDNHRVRSVVRFLMALQQLAARENSATNRHSSAATSAVVHPWPSHQLESTVHLIRNFPAQDPYPFLRRFYPSESYRPRNATAAIARKSPSISPFDQLYREMVASNQPSRHWNDSVYRVEHIFPDPETPLQAHVVLSTSQPQDAAESSHSVTLTVPCGTRTDAALTTTTTTARNPSVLCLTAGLEAATTSMLQAHSAGHDILLLAPPGEGKSAAVAHFAALLHYRRRLVHVHPDTAWADLFLRRITTVNGETAWEPTSLLEAIEEGDLCVLDGVHKLRSDVLHGLQSLCLERDVWLPDGRRVTRRNHHPSWEHGNDIDHPGIVRVHPSFRLVALGIPDGTWLTPEGQGMFSTIELPAPTSDCHRAILHQAHGGTCPPALIDRLLHLRTILTETVAADCGVVPLSTRNLIRVVKQLSTPEATTSDLHRALWQVLVAELLPPPQRATLATLLQQVGIDSDSSNADAASTEGPAPEISIDAAVCRIGTFSMPRSTVLRPERVPSPKFFDIPSHVRILQDLLSTWCRGERAFLLLGNQGVGKNMLVDRLCQIANFEREYIQLHRDSTIGQITLQPTLEGGRVVWNDSPLVRAVTQGLVLVVDEADKAPPEVLAVLKGLVEDGELQLGDGRRISRHDSGPGVIDLHPSFTLFVLANRPGFPFLGNAFFNQIGDCFATRVVANPDLESEVRLLHSYGPNVELPIIQKIAAGFAELRELADSGDLSYPYSTREAVAIVKHLERYPDDGVASALHNVIDFDSFDPLVYNTLVEVFQRQGVPVDGYAQWQQRVRQQGMQLLKEGWMERKFQDAGTSARPPQLSSPKEGKWDEKNEAHVGGNQWAGGTGGSDTAGLGGRGGPYRLDRGHKVHQVSDAAKAQVSAEAAEAARKMAQDALQARLQEIEMSEMEWTMYHRFVESIEKDISNLKGVLGQAIVKQSDRRWLTRQSHGELDEMRLVEGVTGSHNIYKRRNVNSEEGSAPLRPKHLYFVVDVSGSMYRFNGYDGRLTRCLEATSLVMESLNGFEHLFDYRIVGHSGDSASIPLVDLGHPPNNERVRLHVLQTMLAHAQYCQSGDNTLEALAEAIQDAKRGADADSGNSIVVAISDANLHRYGIRPRALGRIISAGQESSVAAHCIFIASFGDEAQEILRELPAGRGHICLETSDLPRIVKDIIAAQL